MSVLRAHQGERDGDRGSNLGRGCLMADRTANVTWSGSLIEGGGRIDSVGSGALDPLDVTWASRAEDSDRRTSPPDLIAPAPAACFSMGPSPRLPQPGTP